MDFVDTQKCAYTNCTYMCNSLRLYVVSLFLFSTCLCRIFCSYTRYCVRIRAAVVCIYAQRIYDTRIYALHIYVLFIYVHFPTNRCVHIYVHEFYICTSKKGIGGCTYMCKNARIQTALCKLRLYEPKSPY